MIKAIFNADDFGFTKGINKGIAYCIKKGVVSSTSLLTNTPSTENAFSIIKKNKIEDIGIHLNLTDGKSLNGKSSITNNKGHFIGAYPLLSKLFLKLVRLKDIKEEFKSQIEILIDHKVQPTHIDSHMYLHSYKPISNICIELAKKYSIKIIRRSYEPNPIRSKQILLDPQYYKLLFINNLSKQQKTELNSDNIKTTDYFHGILQIGSKDPLKYFIGLAKNLKEGTHEIMCHPGYADEELKKYSPYTTNREKELKALCSPMLKKALNKKKVSLIGFKDLE